MKTFNGLIAAGILAAACSFASGAEAHVSTQDFVQKASVANAFEVESSKLALQKSQNDEVKQFAKDMVDDHTKAGQQLATALESSQSGVQAAQGLDKKHQKMMDKLQSLSGSDFDSKYIDMQLKAHKDAVDLFSDYAKHGKDASLQNFAATTLPTLQGHLAHIKQVKSDVK